MNSKSLINGIQGDSLPLADRACQYGDGVFETIAVYESQALCLEEHLQRLLKGCERLSIDFQDIEKLKQEIDSCIQDISKAVLKIQITRGQGGRGYQAAETITPTRIVSLSAFPEYPKTFYTDGVKVRLAQTRYGHNALLAGIKHMNRLEQILASNESYDETIAESIMLDVDGNIIEGTKSNVFICKNDLVITPDLTLCGIEGVIRDKAIEALEKQNTEVEVRNINLSELEKADEVFLTNSILGVWSVSQFESNSYDGNKISKEVHTALVEKKCIVP